MYHYIAFIAIKVTLEMNAAKIFAINIIYFK